MKFLDDGLAVIGCALIVYGISQISTPAAWIAAGIFCVIGGFVIGKVKA